MFGQMIGLRNTVPSSAPRIVPLGLGQAFLSLNSLTCAMLGVIVAHDSPNYIWRWFRRLTDPILVPIAFITPAYVAPKYLPPIAAYWLAIARLLYYVSLYGLGLAPSLGPRGGG